MTNGTPITDGSDREIVDYLRTQSWEGAFTPVPFVVTTWERHLGTHVGPRARSLPHELDGSISREKLAELSEQATTRVGRQRLLLGALIWGRGKRNARMLPGMIDALTSPGLDGTLSATRRLVHRGYPAEAYDRWVDASIPGLREAFFTKWLWAAGLSAPAGVPLRPLVLDSQVWASLGRLGWSSETTTGRKYRHSPSSAYAAYLAATHRWADWLRDGGVDVDAEDIEQLLFRMGGAETD